MARFGMQFLVAMVTVMLVTQQFAVLAEPAPDREVRQAPKFCWRLRVDCDNEPTHICCGVGSNQPTRHVNISPAHG